eukprot:1467507-Prymnesium_polylepis.1
MLQWWRSATSSMALQRWRSAIRVVTMAQRQRQEGGRDRYGFRSAPSRSAIHTEGCMNLSPRVFPAVVPRT